MMMRVFALWAALALCGCSSLGGAQTCLLPSQKPMVEAQLFFGRDIEGRALVSDTEWADFAATTIAKDFPDGFTTSDGVGQWRDPSGAVVHEPSKIVLVTAEKSDAMASKLGDVIQAYRTRFHQQAVGVVTRPVCAAF
jgi:hypothetical protein